jgi:Dirigent-like protein
LRRLHAVSLISRLPIGQQCVMIGPMLRVAVLLGSMSVLLALPATASDAAATKSITIRVLVIRVVRSVKDVPPKTINLGEYSKGDTITTSDVLRNAVPQFGKPKGARVGTGHGVTVALSSSMAKSDGVARFPGGTLHTHGAGKIGPTAKVAVVGGTGTYAGATGVAVFSHLANGTTQSVIRLNVP